MRHLTRRELALMLGVSTLAGTTRAEGSGPVALPGVVGVAEAKAKLGQPLIRERADRAIAGAMAAAVGAGSGVEAAASIFTPGDTVGIKVNCLAGRSLSPRVELVEALVDILAGAGVYRRKIIVFERSSRELERAGFTIHRQGPPYRCIGTDNDYDRMPSSSGAIGSCFARIVSTECTALVSFGIVKDHDLSGVSAGMKNWYGVIHNPNKYHDNGCDPYIVDVARHPFIRDKLRLTVLDGVVAQCHGGPAYRAGATFELGLVAASTDPVAADLWAWQVIEAERRRRGMPTLEEAGRPVRFLATAARHGLGVDDPDRLSLVTA
ncbi:MAG: DUF362 domain-containing protein [Acidobacteria bacterium]|nr:DUF362 domain-containing protein [Candidatus Sulfomarinibacter sp. MAG AM1]